jgi:hypothetical protein
MDFLCVHQNTICISMLATIANFLATSAGIHVCVMMIGEPLWFDLVPIVAIVFVER